MYVIIHQEVLEDGKLSIHFTSRVHKRFNVLSSKMFIEYDKGCIGMSSSFDSLPTTTTTGSLYGLLYTRALVSVDKEYPELMEPLRNLMQKSSFRQW